MSSFQICEPNQGAILMYSTCPLSMSIFTENRNIKMTTFDPNCYVDFVSKNKVFMIS